MKSIEIDDDLYAFIASQTKHIGESASQILRRLLLPEDGAAVNTPQATPAAPKVETPLHKRLFQKIFKRTRKTILSMRCHRMRLQPSPSALINSCLS